MDPLTEFEIRCYEISGDINTAIQAREIITHCIDMNLIAEADLPDLIIDGLL